MRLFRLGVPTEVGESVVLERFGCCNCRPYHVCCYCGEPPKEIDYRPDGGAQWKPNSDCPGQRAKYRVTRIE